MHLGNGVVCPISAIVMFGAAGVGTYFAFRGAEKEGVGRNRNVFILF